LKCANLQPIHDRQWKAPWTANKKHAQTLFGGKDHTQAHSRRKSASAHLTQARTVNYFFSDHHAIQVTYTDALPATVQVKARLR
jgi:hypothetical protein